MKKTILMLIIGIACCVMACKKSNHAPGVSAGLFGKWELRRVHGGLAGLDSTLAKGNGTAFQFKSDSSYVHFFRGTQNAMGPFRIIKGGYKMGDQSYDEIVFDTAASGDPIFLNGTTMSIGTMAADGLEYDYEKISD